jgi:hypothetical protein
VAEVADHASRLAPNSGNTQAAVALKHLVRSESSSAREAADRARTASPDSILELHVYLDVGVVTIDDSNYDAVVDLGSVKE